MSCRLSISNADTMLLALKVEEGGPPAKECGWHLEAEKGKEMDSPLEPLEGAQSLRHLVLAP